MQDKHIDEELVQIFTDIADNLLMHKATPRSEFHLDLDRVAVQKIKALITTEQLAILERLLEKRSLLTDPQYGEKVVPISAIQQQIDSIKQEDK